MVRADARAMLDRILEPFNEKQRADRKSSVTLRGFVENEYLVTKSRTSKTSTRLTTEQIIETHILAPLGERLLIDLPLTRVAGAP